LRVATPATAVILVAMATLAVAMLTVRRHRIVVIAALAGLASVAFWIALGPSTPRVHAGVLEVTSIDVGKEIRFCW